MKSLVAVLMLCIGLSECFQNGDVRLFQDYLKGRLEVYYQGEWGSVCFDAINEQKGMAQAVCRQLGQRDYLSVWKLDDMPRYEDNNTDPILAKVYCPSSENPDYGEQHILRCKFSAESADLDCNVGDEVGIECLPEAIIAEPYNTMVRLQNPIVQETSSGFLEVYVNEDWGTVCNMELADASAACRQLGFTGAQSVEPMENDTTTNLPLVDKFNCEAETDQTCLRKCFEYPIEDVFVDCKDELSFVTCTFEEARSDDKYGSRSTCEDNSNSGLSAGAIAGVAIGSVLAVVLLLVVVLGVFIYLLPKCRSKKTKYDAI